MGQGPRIAGAVVGLLVAISAGTAWAVPRVDDRLAAAARAETGLPVVAEGRTLEVGATLSADERRRLEGLPGVRRVVELELAVGEPTADPDPPPTSAPTGAPPTTATSTTATSTTATSTTATSTTATSTSTTSTSTTATSTTTTTRPSTTTTAGAPPLAEVLPADDALLFRPGSADVGDLDAAILDRVAEALVARPEARLLISGHADDTDDPVADLLLSAERGQAVAEALVHRGVGPEQLLVEAWGSRRPLAEDGSEGQLARNRRVELRPAEEA